jgi:hypothetical protein
MSEIVEQARALYPSDRLSWLPPALAAALAGYDTTTVFTPRQDAVPAPGHGQAAATTAPAAAAAGLGASSAATAPLKSDAPQYAPSQEAMPGTTVPIGAVAKAANPANAAADVPFAQGDATPDYTSTRPMPYQSPYPQPPRKSVNKLVPTLIGGAAVLIVLILLLAHAFSGNSNNANAGNNTPLGESSSSAQLGASGAGGPTGTAPTDAGTNLAAGFSAEYTGQQFTMPGASCTQNGFNDEDFIPSSVVFAQTGPQVSTDGGSNDLALHCNDSSSGTGVTDLEPDNFQIALVTGTPTAAACYSAVQHEPIAGNIRYTDLHDGEEFCLAGGMNSQQLVFLQLDNTDGSTFDLSWTATGWALPANSNN